MKCCGNLCYMLNVVSAATFMEHWKRKQMRLNYRWDLTGFEEEEVCPFSSDSLPCTLLLL